MTENTIHPTETDAQVFERCKRTAALKDLQFILRIAEQRLCEFECLPETLAILAEMTALEQQLHDVAGTPALQKRVGHLVMRYRASIPQYTRRGYPSPYRKDGRRRWVGHRSATAQRVQRLDIEGVRELIHVAMTTAIVDYAPTKPIRKPKAKAEAGLVVACPQCSDALVLAGPHAAHGVLVCKRCDQMWSLAPLKVKATRPRPARPPVQHARDHRTADEKTCTRCSDTHPIKQYLWGAGKTERNVCLTCRKAMQKAATERRKAA